MNSSLHSFYIPVLGTGFTIDSPLAVAKYGIDSVISLVDDALIEQMRRHWCKKLDEPYTEINSQNLDARALRITAYLNLLQKFISKQITDLRASSFEPGSEITKYFEMLPDSPIKKIYQEMLVAPQSEKNALQKSLREKTTVGSIDVNIMTKLDRANSRDGELLSYEFNDAAAALRGYANSNITSSLILSAGFNPHLYGYMTNFIDFYPDKNGEIKKKICLKVSDYRSAAIQGKYLAKHGLWVSEYRIESPLNCGGHAFINDGQLLGPILEEFKQRKDELIETLHGFYVHALKNIKKFCSDFPKNVKITAQGGIGTNYEHEFLIKRYKLDATGWGTPFLLVPEVTNVDDEHLQKLIDAKEEDVFLSAASPLGVPFWNLKNSSSENARIDRINNGTPGAICTKGYAKLDQEFSQSPLCRASSIYQKLKLQALEKTSLFGEQLAELKKDILSKACVCNDLAGGAVIKNRIDTKIKSALCPGPNIINFKKIVTLKEMVDHIYGRCSLIANENRPNLFIRELQLQLSYLADEIKKSSLGLPTRSMQKLAEVKKNLSEGIDYYKNLATELLKEQQEKFLAALKELQKDLENIATEL